MCLPLVHKFLKIMKKFSLIALFAALVAVNVHAADLFTGSKHVSWNEGGEGGLQIAATDFANAQPGQKIVITYTDAKEMDGSVNKGSVIEFKVMNGHFDHLAGSREALRLWDNGSLEHFLTASAVDSLKAYGLEIIGNDFTVTKVELLDGKTLKEGFTVWTGFFWADEWSTLELYYNGYAGVDWSKATALRIYSEANRTDYLLQIVKAWGEPAVLTASKDAFTINNEYAELPLTDELRTELKESSHWMIQFNKESGNPFNVTDVVLVMEEESTAISNTAVESKAVKFFENGQLVIIKNGVKYNALGAKL